MKSMTKNWIIGGLGATVLVAGTALAASYATRESLEPAPAPVVAQQAPVQHPPRRQGQQMASAQPKCNDGNIVGTLAGGVGGGLVGSAFGRGGGKTATTIGGALGGAYLGNQYLPTRNATCR